MTFRLKFLLAHKLANTPQNNENFIHVAASTQIRKSPYIYFRQPLFLSALSLSQNQFIFIRTLEQKEPGYKKLVRTKKKRVIKKTTDTTRQLIKLFSRNSTWRPSGMLKLCGNIWEIGALVVYSKSCGAPNPSRSAGVHLFGKKWIFFG